MTKNASEGSFARKAHYIKHRSLLSRSATSLSQTTKHKQSSKWTPRQPFSSRQANFTAKPSQRLYLLTQRTPGIASEYCFLQQLFSRAFVMDDSNVNEYSETRAPCHRFAASGNCSGCQNEHHPNLSPALVGMVVPQQYRIPNEVGVACQGCIDTLREAGGTSTDR